MRKRSTRALEKIHKNTDILILHQTTRHVDTGDRILQALSKLSVTPSTTHSPLWTIPFGRDPDFVDRGSLVDQLLDKSALPASRMALVGLGGGRGESGPSNTQTTGEETDLAIESHSSQSNLPTELRSDHPRLGCSGY